MSSNGFVCWKCGSSIDYLRPPIGRREICKKCSVELHVCKMCVEFDRSSAHACREPMAEEVREKEKANFCDYFKLRSNAYLAPAQDAAAAAKSALDKLFNK